MSGNTVFSEYPSGWTCLIERGGEFTLGEGNNFEENLKKLGLTLPVPPGPVAHYVSSVRVGNLLLTSGILPMREGKVAYTGKLGRELSLADGQEAARLATLNALSVLRQDLGSLDKVSRVVKLTGYIASGEGFTQQPAVLNAASDLLIGIFGESGRHARAAVGAAELPLGAAVEIEIIIQFES